MLNERIEHELRFLRLVVNQRLHVGKCIEQKMRLDLRLQRAQLGVARLCRQSLLRFAIFCFLCLGTQAT